MAKSIPTATYRLQFHAGYTFHDAREIVPYLHRLGISHVYASPIFRAPPESTHGYDIADHNALNPVLGTRADYDALIAELAAHGLGMILDFVPNHMGVARSLNPYWMDVLENGPSSVYAAYFDIDWHPLKEELENRVLLPILSDQYGRVLERGEFKVEFRDGRFSLSYFETELPLGPRSYAQILRPALEQLAGAEAKTEAALELQSILSSIEHLPVRTDQNPEHVQERAREKEIVKRRLGRLCQEAPEVEAAIAKVLAALQGDPADRRSFDALHELIAAQTYRLSYWRVAAEEINYRRFFDINELAAIRMESPAVFDDLHRLVFELLGDVVTGLRIDHVDGLWDPREYLVKLQQGFAERRGAKPEELPLYLLVEKILSNGEKLRPDWPIHGTTGYEFVTEVTELLIDAAASREITDAYAKFLDDRVNFEDLVYEKKQQIMRLSMASEINALAHRLNRISEQNRWFRDFTLGALTTAVREVIACFPVYRTYSVPGQPVSDSDAQILKRAISGAKRRNPAIERSVFDFLHGVLLLSFPENLDEAGRAAHEEFVMKFQQCTGPIMAKGLEDTAFYLYNRLVALNEVGGEPQHFGFTVAKFHEQNAARQREFPHSMLASSTHDTKKSEDVRARLAVISELPTLWRRSLGRWRTVNRKWKREVDGVLAPDANEEYLLYQILLGTWPGENLEEKAHANYVERIQAYMTKAIKEGKVNSSWVQPNEGWDEAVRGFIAGVLEPRNAAFRRVFEPVATEVAEGGFLNALTQTVLKCCAPGVPDFYQGNETWDYSLVDPDNRRPVDYAARRALLEQVEKLALETWLAQWRDGRLKLFAVQTLLRLRAENSELFGAGSYEPCEVSGEFAANVVAFQRRLGAEVLLVVVPRLTRRLPFPAIGDVWHDTALPRVEARTWRDVFTGDEIVSETGGLELRRVFARLPFAVLRSRADERS